MLESDLGHFPVGNTTDKKEEPRFPFNRNPKRRCSLPEQIYDAPALTCENARYAVLASLRSGQHISKSWVTLG